MYTVTEITQKDDQDGVPKDILPVKTADYKTGGLAEKLKLLQTKAKTRLHSFILLSEQSSFQ